MSLLSRLFGGAGAAKSEVEPIRYKEFDIVPAPVKEGGRHRVGALVRKEIDGELKEHHLIRADALDTHDAAVEISIAKAKQVIDEQGDGLFR